MNESLQDVTILSRSSTFTTKERLQICCKPTYKPRRVKNKGAILVLVLNILVITVLHPLRLEWDADYNTEYESIPKLYYIVVAFGLTLPIAGWLADVHIGRYKMIYYSIWIMWIATVLATLSTVITELDLVDNYSKFNTKVVLVLHVFVAIGFSGYEANIIQFGMDQLYDASTSEIMSFIIWYVCTILSAGVIFISACLFKQYMIIRQFVPSVNLSLALIVLICWNYWLVKEPVKHNSLKLVYKVVKYAIKTKQPRCRSAFTYCEDELPSRIDFGKSKYGGPFTTEQVEDVKTFLRLIPMALVGGALAASGSMVSNSFLKELNKMFVKFDEVDLAADGLRTSVINCYSEASFPLTVYIIPIPLILLHEILLYPIFHRCFPRVESLQKVSLGMFIQLVGVLILMVYEIVSSHNYLQKSSNETISCQTLFYAPQGTLSTAFDYRWMIVPDFILSISNLMIYAGSIEYWSAQVPYFMKGLVVGLTYSSLLITGGIWKIVSILFKKQKVSHIWGKNCGVWYALLLSASEMGICVTLTILIRCYKKRRRQDVLPNEHIFAERYYSRID